jgi:limonene-1,2-epoxide hydrolase
VRNEISLVAGQQPLHSVLTLNNRKVTRWRDYLDPIAVFNAVGWPAAH